MSARRVEPKFVERVWGRTDLAPLYGKRDSRIGEVWFPLGDDFPLLVKFIFTDERLSVQVHPDDEYGRLHENSRGKTEMWHILFAEPDATIALGFREEISKERFAASIRDGSIEGLLDWKPVKAGDTLLVPAGAVHAIGAGVVLCEIQQNSDVTYRLWDYGRPRELHIEKGTAVSDTDPYDGRREFPVVCRYFTTEMFEGAFVSDLPGEYLLIPVAGQGTLGGQPFMAGEAWHVPAASGPVEITGVGRILRTRSGA